MVHHAVSATAARPAALEASEDDRELAERFHRDGFLHLAGAFSSAELAGLRQDAERLMAPALRAKIRHTDYTYHQADGQPVLQRINGLINKGPAFLRVWAQPRLLRLVRAIYGEDCLPVDMAMVVKQPGFGVAVGWHRDPAYCRIHHGVNCGIYLDDAAADNGMLHVIPGSHRRRTLDLAAAVQEHGFDLPGAIAVPVAAGDVILHSENLLHGSREVHALRHRRVIYLGMRSIREQLAPDRGLDDGWIRAYAGMLQQAQASRAEVGLDAPGQDRPWQPTRPEHRWDGAPGDFIQQRIEGNNSFASPELALPFDDEVPELSTRA